MGYQKKNKDGRVRSGRKPMADRGAIKVQVPVEIPQSEVDAKGGYQVVKEALTEAVKLLPVIAPFDPREGAAFEPREEVKEGGK